MHTSKLGPITDAPLTAEARDTLLETLFAENMPHYGELFIPDDSFYTNSTGQKLAEHMLQQLCQWLGIKPGYIGLIYETDPEHTPDGRRYTVYLESWVIKDEFYLGATLAYALVRYLVEEKKQIHFTPDSQSVILAAASVEFGLGLVIINGLSPIYGWADRWIIKLLAPSHSVVGTYAVQSYGNLVRGFIAKYRIHPATFRHTLTPWSASRLLIRQTGRTTKAVADTRHKIHLENIKFVGTCWCIALVIGLGSYIYSMRATPIAPELLKAQEELVLLNNVTRECKEATAYKRQYADAADIQTIRSLNAQNSRCESLENQRQAAEQNYRRLTAPE